MEPRLPEWVIRFLMFLLPFAMSYVVIMAKDVVRTRWASALAIGFLALNLHLFLVMMAAGGEAAHGLLQNRNISLTDQEISALVDLELMPSFAFLVPFGAVGGLVVGLMHLRLTRATRHHESFDDWHRRTIIGD